MNDDRQILATLCSCGIPMDQHTPFMWRCTPSVVAPAMTEEALNRRIGAAAAATKRARGQDLIPRLHLKGSKAKPAGLAG